MGRKRSNLRPVNGVLLLDKPPGATSNQALQRVKHLFRARKAGHTGSLDPLATGLLPLCFGEATKISAFLLNADKHYRVHARLGARTDTADRDGKVLEERDTAGITDGDIAAALAGFRGEIQQVPPMYSARKHKGKRLYELARQGVEVERAPQAVTIHQLDLLRRDGDELELDVACTKGTYVRTLVEDIGEKLGCGAHVAELRRLGVAPYAGQPMHTMDELEARREESGPEALDELLLPVDTALIYLPEVALSGDTAFYLRQGQPVLVPNAPTGGDVRLYQDGRFLGVGEVLPDGRVGPRRLLRL